MMALTVPAQASYVLDIFQNGPDVITSGSGSVDLTGLFFIGSGTAATQDYISAGMADALTGGGVGTVVGLYGGLSGPASFGTDGTDHYASSSAGDAFGIDGTVPFILVSSGYASGSVMSGSAVWSGTTLAGLGLTTGSYQYTWGSGAHADSLVVNVGVVTVPEPSAWVLLGIGAIVLGAVIYRRGNPVRGLPSPDLRVR